jgi:hypothetical protein
VLGSGDATARVPDICRAVLREIDFVLRLPASRARKGDH